MTRCLFFDSAGDAPLELVGGKGRNLIALSAAGFPVPPGFVLTTALFEAFRAASPDLLPPASAPDPGRLGLVCDELRRRPLPAEVEREVREALARLEAGCGRRRLAVRSSCTAEDGDLGASAGQYDSFLGLDGADAVLDAVRGCYLSLWSPHAAAYRRRRGIAESGARMAVVVQQLVEAEVAGVGFSVDPVSGRTDRMVIDANFGLGESVVDGAHAVDHFELDKRDLKTVGQTLARKERQVVPSGNGVRETRVPAADRDRPALSDEQRRAVAELLRRAEAHFGWPQDVEWAFAGGRLWILQSRPVTAIPPRWTRDESAERFPGPMSPLSWSFIREIFRRSLSHSLDLMGLPRFTRDWFALHDHHVYGDQNAVALLAAFSPFRARSSSELIAELPEIARRFSWVVSLPEDWDRARDLYLMRLGALAAVEPEAEDAATLWRLLLDLQELAGDYFRPNIAISMTQALLHRVLRALVTMLRGAGEADRVVDGLLAGCGTRTLAVNRDLHRLAVRLESTPALAREVLAEGGRAVWERGRVADFPAFEAPLRELLREHGHRELDMDFLHPTWSAAPWIVLDTLAAMLRGGLGDDPALAARRREEEQARFEADLVAACPEELRFFLKEVVRLARSYTALDDLEHYETTRMNPVGRGLALALGRRLMEAGFLDAPEDVFFLEKEELEACVAAGLPRRLAAAHRQRARAVRASCEASRAQPPPWSRGDESAADAVVEVEADTWRGLPGSPGSVRAPCFVVHGPQDFARFPSGAVLVVRTTGPAWTPLFYSAAALVAETGGPLSHGAVTAREMQLPAVMSARGALAAFRNGDVLSVDGTAGVVRRL